MFTVMENECDRNKFLKIYEEYRSLMFYVAEDILKDHALAEDAVSESFIKIMHNLHKIDQIPCHKTKAFIVIIVKNTALNVYNKMRSEKSLETELEKTTDNIPQVSDEIINKESYKNIIDIINSLPDALRNVAVLSLLHGLKNKEIAEIMGISYDTTRKRTLRSRNAIKAIWLKQYSGR